VLEVTERVVTRIRKGEGPALIECKTYRYRGHSEHDAALYRDQEELIEWQSRDPIPRYELFLEKKGHDVKHIREQIDERAQKVVQEAVDFAERSALPKAEEALEDLTAPSPAPAPKGK
jgi:TPP-dependent pyruvate/acetoin dehydrogenase alpha subunit